MKKLLLMLLVACTNEPDSDACIFDGRYEMGMLPTNGCGANSETLYANNEEDECYTSQDIIALDGTRRTLYLSCEAGNPVVECSGFANSSDGCSWDMYMRRIAE